MYTNSNKYNNFIERIHNEESLYPEVKEGQLSHQQAHYLATHPLAMNDHKELQQDLKRMYRF